MTNEDKVKKLVSWIQRNTQDAKKLVIPISGGTDSALVLQLFKLAYEKDYQYLYKVVPVFCVDREPRLELRCFDWFEDNFKPLYIYLENNFSEIFRWAEIQSNARANKAWIVGSRNKTEDFLGTYSLASRVATVLPIVGLSKTEVMELCKYLDIPEEIIESSRKVDIDCGRGYEEVDLGIEAIDEAIKVYPLTTMNYEASKYVRETVVKNHFKNLLPYRGPRFQ